MVWRWSPAAVRSRGRAFIVIAAISLAKHYGAELHMICVEELPMLPTTIDEVVEEREEADHRYEKVIERAQSLCYMQDVDVVTHDV